MEDIRSKFSRSETSGEIKVHDNGDGFPFVTLKNAAGSTAKVYFYGAHATSFKDSTGIEHLFMSNKAEFKVGKALRGGIPVCWPQFGPGKLPQHGFARNTEWTLTDSQISPATASVTLTLRPNSESLKVFPHQFELHYTIEITGDHMKTIFNVKNTGTEAFEWTGALHTYFSISAIESTTVKGLQGTTFIDKVKDGQKFTEENESIKFDSQLDRVYLEGGSRHVDIVEPKSTERVTFEAWEDVVVWNPWVEKAAGMADMGEGQWKNFVCVEAVQVGKTITTSPGETWTGSYGFGRL